MTIPVSWTGAGVIIVVIGHAVLLVRGWTIIEMRLKSMTEAFASLNNSLAERDKRMDAAWRRIDDHEHRITITETKCKVNHGEET